MTGGPGGSGVEALLDRGKSLKKVVGDNHVSFGSSICRKSKSDVPRISSALILAGVSLLKQPKSEY